MVEPVLAVATPLALTVAMLDENPQWRERMSQKVAHDFLKHMRDTTDPDTDCIDLTDQPLAQRFDWRRYIGGRPDAETMIHTGITKFEFRHMHFKDSNTKERRGDFVVQRADGSAVRLHPSNKGICPQTGLREAIPIFGTMEDWDPHKLRHQVLPAPAAGLPGTAFAPPQGQGPGYTAISQADLRGRREAAEFLRAQVETWQSRPFHGTFSRFLLASEWNWPLFLSNGKLAHSFVGEVVERFGIAWETRDTGDGRPVFYGSTVSGRNFTIVVDGGASGRSQLRWDWDRVHFG